VGNLSGVWRLVEARFSPATLMVKKQLVDVVVSAAVVIDFKSVD
jgi:hypothetical protein